MWTEPGLELDPRMQTALEELQTTISQEYPGARFRVSRGEDDPTIVQLVTIVEVDDTDRVLDAVMGRLFELQAEELPVFVVTERPPAMLGDAEGHQRAAVPTAPL